MQIADLFGAAAEPFEFEGVTYKLRPPTLEEQYEFQVWLEGRARDAVGRDADAPDPLARAARRDVVNAIAAGEYEYDGEHAYRARLTFTGSGKLLSIIHKTDHETGRRLAKAAAERNVELLGKAVLDEDPFAVESLLSGISRFFGLPSDFLSRPSSTSTGRKRGTRSRASRTPSSGASGAASNATSGQAASAPPGN